MGLGYSLCLELETMLDEGFSARRVCPSEMIDATCSVFPRDRTAGGRVDEVLTERTPRQLQAFGRTSDGMVESSGNAESHRLSVASWTLVLLMLLSCEEKELRSAV